MLVTLPTKQSLPRIRGMSTSVRIPDRLGLCVGARKSFLTVQGRRRLRSAVLGGGKNLSEASFSRMRYLDDDFNGAG